jgi:hypothetical protein
MGETFDLAPEEAEDAVTSLLSGQGFQVTQTRVASPIQVTARPGPLPYPPEVRRGSGGCLRLAVFLVLATLMAVGFIFFLPRTTEEAITSVVSEVTNVVDEASAVATAIELPKLPAEAQAMLNTLNSTFGTEVMRFGSEGMGPGKFEDARAIAVDGLGHIFVGDYMSGRIQAFDAEGNFLSQWSLGAESYVDQFAADREGRLFVPDGGELSIYDGLTGAPLGTLPWVDQESWGRYDDSVALGADGGVYGVWDGDVVRFDRNLQLDLRIADAVASATGGLETTTVLAVNGVGEIYALGESLDVVAKFAPDGRFVDQFGGRGDDEGSFTAASSIAVDSQGRVYVGDFAGVKVYSPAGQYLDAIGTSGYPLGIALDEKDNLYVASRTEVIKYTVPE